MVPPKGIKHVDLNMSNRMQWTKVKSTNVIYVTQIHCLTISNTSVSEMRVIMFVKRHSTT